MKIFFLILVVTGAAWNLRSYYNLECSRANALQQASAVGEVMPGNSDENAVEAVPWTLLEQTKYAPGEKPQFPIALKALAGRQASIKGVVMSIKSMEKDGKTKGALLMPLAKIGCCGAACANDPRTMLFVSFEKIAMPLSQPKITATVTGRLSLSTDDGAWCLFTLEDASVEKIEYVAEVRP